MSCKRHPQRKGNSMPDRSNSASCLSATSLMISGSDQFPTSLGEAFADAVAGARAGRHKSISEKLITSL